MAPEGSLRLLKAPEDLKLSVSKSEHLTRTSYCLFCEVKVAEYEVQCPNVAPGLPQCRPGRGRL